MLQPWLTECSYTWEDVKAGSDEVEDPFNAHYRWVWCEAWDDWIVVRSLAFHGQSFVTPHPNLMGSISLKLPGFRWSEMRRWLGLLSERTGEKFSTPDQSKQFWRRSKVLKEKVQTAYLCLENALVAGNHCKCSDFGWSWSSGVIPERRLS